LNGVRLNAKGEREEAWGTARVQNSEGRNGRFHTGSSVQKNRGGGQKRVLEEKRVEGPACGA